MADMFGQEDIRRLAALAWLGIDVQEAERLCADMNGIAADLAAFVEADFGDGGGNGGGGGAWGDALRTDGLREDVPTRDVEPDTLKEQSPSAGGDGFTIPLMIEG